MQLEKLEAWVERDAQITYVSPSDGNFPFNSNFRYALVKLTLKDYPWDSFFWLTPNQSSQDTVEVSLSQLLYRPALLQANNDNPALNFHSKVWNLELSLKELKQAPLYLYSNTSIGNLSKLENKVTRKATKLLESWKLEDENFGEYLNFRIDILNSEAGLPLEFSHTGIFEFLLHCIQAKKEAASYLTTNSTSITSWNDGLDINSFTYPSLSRLYLFETQVPNYLVHGKKDSIPAHIKKLMNNEHQGNDVVNQKLEAMLAEFNTSANATDTTLNFVLDNLLDSGQTSVQDLKGSYVLLDFWATWCKPCIKSFPELSNLVNETENLRLVGVNVEIDKSFGQRFLEKNDWISWHQTIDYENQKLQRIFNIVGYPWYVLLSPSGEIISTSLPHEINHLKKTLEEAIK